MAITKLSSGPYTIHTINNDPITLDAGNVYINGNLIVTGITSAIETNNTTVYDNIITLNGGVIGTPLLNAGIEVNRGTSSNVSILWNETLKVWQLTNNGSTYGNIATLVNSSASPLTAIIQDPNPALGGNLNLNSYTVSSNIGNMNFQGNLQLNNTSIIPNVSVTNATVVYSSVPNSGASGLYVVNQSSLNEELVTKRRALGFSILF